MIGSIIGDVIGSIYEFHNLKSKDFPLFSKGCHYSDDTVMTVAVYRALLEADGKYNNLTSLLIKNMKELGNKYYDAGYGGRFRQWLKSDLSEPYYSFGNGSAMRVSPVALFATSLDEALELAKITSEVTHNHPEGIKGAQVIAGATYLAKNGASKDDIRAFVEKYYSLDYDYDDLVKNYTFHVDCMESVPEAVYCFLISDSYEDCMRTCVSIGGDSDTLCAIAGSIAEYYFGIPKNIYDEGLGYLDKDLTSIISREINNNKKH